MGHFRIIVALWIFIGHVKFWEKQFIPNKIANYSTFPALSLFKIEWKRLWTSLFGYPRPKPFWVDVPNTLDWVPKFTWEKHTGFWERQPSRFGNPWESDMGRVYFFMIVNINVFVNSLGMIHFHCDNLLKNSAFLSCYSWVTQHKRGVYHIKWNHLYPSGKMFKYEKIIFLK